MTPADLSACVREAIADALGIDESEIIGSATLLEDLDAESIDLLDILFRIERSSGIKIQVSDIGDTIQGGIPDAEFGDIDETVSAIGLAHLKNVMPQIDVDRLAGNLKAQEIMTLFTVDNLVAIVAAKAAS